MMSALVLSSKVWDDNSMWNRDFSEIFPSFSLGRLNQLEVAVLGVLRVSLRASSPFPRIERGETLHIGCSGPMLRSPDAVVSGRFFAGYLWAGRHRKSVRV